MRTLIVTVGTSLLTNKTDARPWHGWRFRDELPNKDMASSYLETASEEAISAETNTLQALPLQKNDFIVWFHSATDEGQWCAEILSEHYQRQGHRCELIELKGLGYEEENFTSRGLKSLMEHIFDIIKRAGAENVALCATGGFKAEIAFANMIGMLTHVPVYYIHERFRELVELPRVPIDWDISIVEQNLRFFEWIDEEPRSSVEVENWLKANSQLRVFTSGSLAGYTYLSPVGNLLYGAYKIQDSSKPKATWPPFSGLSPNEKNKLQNTEHHRPKGWREFVQRIAEIDCVGTIRYDDRGNKSLKKSIVYDGNNQTGELRVIMSGDDPLTLIVETTARGDTQVNMVKEYIQSRIRNW